MMTTNTMTKTKWRLVFTPIGLGVLMLCAGTASAAIDPASAEGVVAIDRKIHCSTQDRKEVLYTWKGTAYSKVRGERDRLLFKVEGLNMRQCVSVKDSKRGTGYRILGREIMLYLDPKTGEVLRTWNNPWTGKDTEVIHVANDPVNSRSPSYGMKEDGSVADSSVEMRGDKYFLDIVVPLFYPNPLAGDYQKYVGNFYHSVEIFNFSGSAKELLSEDTDSVSPAVSWVRMAPWLPWMEMAGRDGMMYFSATGQKLSSWDDLSPTLKNEVAANYPQYRRAPPINDKRRNQTSWTFFKQELDKKMKRDKRSKRKRR